MNQLIYYLLTLTNVNVACKHTTVTSSKSIIPDYINLYLDFILLSYFVIINTDRLTTTTCQLVCGGYGYMYVSCSDWYKKVLKQPPKSWYDPSIWGFMLPQSTRYRTLK